MRTTLVLLGLTVALLTAIWLGGETLLARSVVSLIAEDPRLQAASVNELREGQRVGLGFTDVIVVTPEARISLPELALWVPPQRPNEVHASLPSQATVDIGGRSMTLGATKAELTARFAPTRGFALWQAGVNLAGLTLDAAPLLERLTATARMAGFGHDAPHAAGAAYEVEVDMAGLSLSALSNSLGGVAAAAGKGRVWLTQPPAQGAEGAAPPALVGLRADGVRLTLDDLAATLWGHVIEGSTGLAEGQLILDTADADALLPRGAAMGMLPPAVVPFAGMLLKGAASTPPPGSAAAPNDAAATPQGGAEPGLVRQGTAEAVAQRALDGAEAFPPPPEGQLRIILTFRDGKSWLGGVPVGPAPRFR